MSDDIRTEDDLAGLLPSEIVAAFDRLRAERNALAAELETREALFDLDNESTEALSARIGAADAFAVAGAELRAVLSDAIDAHTPEDVLARAYAALARPASERGSEILELANALAGLLEMVLDDEVRNRWIPEGGDLSRRVPREAIERWRALGLGRR